MGKNYLTEGLIFGMLAGTILSVLGIFSWGLGVGLGMLLGLVVGMLIPRKQKN